MIRLNHAPEVQVIRAGHQCHIEAFRQPVLVNAVRRPVLLEEFPIHGEWREAGHSPISRRDDDPVQVRPKRQPPGILAFVA